MSSIKFYIFYNNNKTACKVSQQTQNIYKLLLVGLLAHSLLFFYSLMTIIMFLNFKFEC